MHIALIMDENREFTDILTRKVRRNGEEIEREMATVLSGAERAIVEQMYLLHPEVILMDTVVSDPGGKYAERSISDNAEEKGPVIFVLTGAGSERIVSALNLLDTDLLNIKSLSFDIVLHGMEVEEEPRRVEVRETAAPMAEPEHLRVHTESRGNQVRNLVTRMGIPPHRVSTQCISDALLYCLEHPDGTRLITKVLYPEVAKKNKMTSMSVEKNIRHAIATAQKANAPIFNQIFSYSHERRITNGEFLAVVTEYLSSHMDDEPMVG